MFEDAIPTENRIRSYVIRQGRLSKGQKRALEEQYPHYLFEASYFSSPQLAFPSQQPLTLEVGFGMGDSLVQMAAEATDQNFLGLEVHGPGVGHLILETERRRLTNLRVINADVWSVLPKLADQSLARIQVFFPDPWHKKRHHKRRLVDTAFLDCAAAKLSPNGLLHLATDWLPYAEVMETTLQGHDAFEFCEPPPRPVTKYEKRGLRLGHTVRDIAARLTA